MSKQLSFITLIALVTAPTAYSQSDEDILETVRASATKIFLEQASWTLPESFDVPLSDMVSDDGSFTFKGASRYEYDLLINPCIERAWEAVGASHEYD